MRTDEHDGYSEAKTEPTPAAHDVSRIDDTAPSQVNNDGLPAELAKAIRQDRELRLAAAREHQNLVLPKIKAAIRARIASMQETSPVERTATPVFRNAITDDPFSGGMSYSIPRVRCTQSGHSRQWHAIVPANFQPTAVGAIPILDAAATGHSFPEFVVGIDAGEITGWSGDIMVAVDVKRSKLLVSTQLPEHAPGAKAWTARVIAAKGAQVFWAVDLSESTPALTVDYPSELGWEGVEFTVRLEQ